MGYNSNGGENNDHHGTMKNHKKKGFGRFVHAASSKTKKSSSDGNTNNKSSRRTRSVSPFKPKRSKSSSNSKKKKEKNSSNKLGSGGGGGKRRHRSVSPISGGEDHHNYSSKKDIDIPKGYSSRALQDIINVDHDHHHHTNNNNHHYPYHHMPSGMEKRSLVPTASSRSFQRSNSNKNDIITTNNNDITTTSTFDYTETPSLFNSNINNEKNGGIKHKAKKVKHHILYFCKTKFFNELCNKAFDHIDADNSGSIDESELYAGLLLIQLKLGSYIGPAACKPMSRDQTKKFFLKFNKNQNGTLDRTEFRKIMKVLFSNILMRVAVQYTLTLTIVPLIAKGVLEFLSFDIEKFWTKWTQPKNTIEFTLDDYIDWTITDYPSSIRTFCTKFSFGSDRFWNTVPLTLTTIVLGLMLVPWSLSYIDDIIHHAVEWLEQRKAKKMN